MERSERKPPRVVAWPLFVARIAVVAVFAVMIVITFLQVVFRYVLTAPLPWSEEAARYCFVWIVFLGAALGLERGVHLGVDLLVNRMPTGMRRNTAVACNICIAGFALILIYASAPVLQLNAWQQSPALGIQVSYVYMAIPVSMALIALIALLRVVQALRGVQT